MNPPRTLPHPPRSENDHTGRSRPVPAAIPGLVLAVLALFGILTGATAAPSIARIWNERALGAIRVDTPHPPAQARNLFSLSVAMYDAWAAYDPVAVGFAYRRKHEAADVAAARREAISYAAYRILVERHFYSKTSTNTLASDDLQMKILGYDIKNVSRDPSTPAGVGNSVYDAVSQWFIEDGARQSAGTQAQPYPDYPVGDGGYEYLNPTLATSMSGIQDGFGHTIVDVNIWQRLQIVNAADQVGFPQGPIQTYLGAQWLGVRPFALTRTDPTRPWVELPPPPRLGTASHAEFRSNVVAVILRSSELTPDDGVVIDISPGAFGNNSLGANDGHGHPLNPATGAPYAPNRVKRGDFARVLAEFWADGPSSETPPGHWNTIANGVTESPGFVRRLGGTGTTLDELEWDVKLYFALNAALHDAACAAWSVKRFYNGWRPLSAIRYMALQGQSSDPNLPSYHTNGLPLIPGSIELVTGTTAVSGERHHGLKPGNIAVLAWPGQPANPNSTHQGVKWIHAIDWIPYQRATFVTPAFPGYISGHSTFSRAAAEVLTIITGSPFFPGGLGTYTAAANKTLGFEKGPSETIVLQWGTYYDAADQAGLSRIWGGIHPPADDFAGRRAGSLAGKTAWSLATRYFDGSIADIPVTLSVAPSVNQGETQFQATTLRGLYYKLQSAPDLHSPFTDEPGNPIQALDTTLVWAQRTEAARRFFRTTCLLSP